MTRAKTKHDIDNRQVAVYARKSKVTETAGADVLLTTDRKFINAAKRSNARIPVRNSLMWLTEVLYDTES